VRRNAAWALGKLGQSASRDVLYAAQTDASGLVRMTAKAALAALR
jgi:HEAT repeat protein